jgi:N-methylhydantoinase B
VLSRTGGGGGYGDPFTRDPDAVCDDVMEGWMSRERAAEIYGVILEESRDGWPGTLVVDVAATEALRSAEAI